MKYAADITTSPKCKNVERIEFEIGKSVEETSYDDVVEMVYAIMDKEYPEDCYPKADFVRLFALEGKEEFPLFAESEKDEIRRATKSKKYPKILVMPEARYSLTPECRLWMGLVDSGLVDGNAEFDYDKCHEIIEKMEKPSSPSK